MGILIFSLKHRHHVVHKSVEFGLILARQYFVCQLVGWRDPVLVVGVQVMEQGRRHGVRQGDNHKRVVLVGQHRRQAVVVARVCDRNLQVQRS